jgi:D-3-phosphoglycerate dehydrogenase / 2-oxoglutarate reductase
MMLPQAELSQFKVIRLNAEISPVDDYEASLYQRHGISPQLVEANRPDEIIPAVQDCDALLVVSSALPAIVIEAMNRCRIISRLGIGTDKIAVEAARQRGILVTNVPGCFSEEMADHTLAFILALARKFPQMRRAMMEGAWNRSRVLSVHNHRLSNCTLGLIGFGDSARLVAQRARVFGMRLIATRRDLQAPNPEAEALGVQIVDLNTLLAEADFVSLHVPLNPQTYHLMDKARLQQMKPGAFLINTARGAIIHEDALVEALETGRLAGAGLDTFEHIDPFTGVDGFQDHALLHMDHVILTPHVAALSEEGMREVSEGGIENLAAVLSGVWPVSERIVNTGVVPRYPLEHVRLANP